MSTFIYNRLTFAPICPTLSIHHQRLELSPLPDSPLLVTKDLLALAKTTNDVRRNQASKRLKRAKSDIHYW